MNIIWTMINFDGSYFPFRIEPSIELHVQMNLRSAFQLNSTD